MSKYWIVFKHEDGRPFIATEGNYCLGEGIRRPERCQLYKRVVHIGPDAAPISPYKKDKCHSIDLEVWDGGRDTRVIRTLWTRPKQKVSNNPTATCIECNRVFDLLDTDDCNEWAYGHDCEV